MRRRIRRSTTRCGKTTVISTPSVRPPSIDDASSSATPNDARQRKPVGFTDVGCGQGELLREMSRAIPNAQVHGADLSEQSLIDSRKRNPTFDLFELNITHEVLR